MSAYEDEIAPNMFDVEQVVYEEAIASSMCHEGWTTKDGSFIPYQRMGTTHLVNCRNLILKKNGWRREFLKYINRELKTRLFVERAGV